jgi:integrase
MEILSLQWDAVNFKRGVITLHETKHGERQSLPLTGHHTGTMERRRRIQTGGARHRS